MKRFEIAPALEPDEWKCRRCGEQQFCEATTLERREGGNSESAPILRA